MKFRHHQVQLLLEAFQRAEILFEVWEIIGDENPHGYAGEDLLVSRHGERQGFIFQNEDGGRILWTAPAENPRLKRRELGAYPMRNADDAYKIACEYSLLCGGPLVA